MFEESDFVPVKLPSTRNVKSADWCFGWSRPPQVLSPLDLDTLFFVSFESDAKSYGCDIFHLCTSVICYGVSAALAYTSAGFLGLKQNGVFTLVITSGYTYCTLRTHGSFDVKLADLGLNSIDQTWHCEQWSHFEFAREEFERATFFCHLARPVMPPWPFSLVLQTRPLGECPVRCVSQRPVPLTIWVFQCPSLFSPHHDESLNLAESSLWHVGE